MEDVRTAHAALVRRYYEAFNRRDYQDMLACLSEDIAHWPNQGALRAGKSRFAEFLQHMDTCYRERVVDLVVLTCAEAPQRVAAEFLIEGQYLKSDADLPPARGQTYRLPVGAFVVVRQGLIVSLRNYYNLADWMAQVAQ